MPPAGPPQMAVNCWTRLGPTSFPASSTLFVLCPLIKVECSLLERCSVHTSLYLWRLCCCFMFPVMHRCVSCVAQQRICKCHITVARWQKQANGGSRLEWKGGRLQVEAAAAGQAVCASPSKDVEGSTASTSDTTSSRSHCCCGAGAAGGA